VVEIGVDSFDEPLYEISEEYGEYSLKKFVLLKRLQIYRVARPVTSHRIDAPGLDRS
jgi:hypothetical protein